MAEKIGYAVSRIRGDIKAVKEDAFITDRFLWSLIVKYAKLFIKNHSEIHRMTKYKSFYRTIPCIELIEVDKIEACCNGITSGCKIMRTKDKLPKPFEGARGPMFRTVFSLDGSIKIHPTEPGTYTSMTKLTSFKFNKQKYYWYLNGYMYFPNIEWEGVLIDGMWEDDINCLACDAQDDKGECTIRQEQYTNIPDYLLADIEKQVLAELFPQAQLPQDSGDDKKDIFR